MDTVLEDIYSNVGGFGGLSSSVDNLYHAARSRDVRLTRSDVQKFLDKKASYTQMARRRFRFKRETVKVSGMDATYAADLADVSNCKAFNNGIVFLLVVVDVFSKYMWVRPLKNKTGQVVATALRDIFRSSKRSCKKFWSDNGKEFYNSHVSKLFRDFGDEIYSTDSDLKCTVTEAAVKNLKHRIYRYMFEKASNRYLPALDEIVRGQPSGRVIHSKFIDCSWRMMDADRVRKRQRKTD